MSQVTYKTIIQNAIKGFNDIQNALHTVGATYDYGTAIPTASTLSPLSIAEILSSDAFRPASFTASIASQTPITASIKPIIKTVNNNPTTTINIARN